MKTSGFLIKDMLKKLKTYMVHNNTNLQVIFLHMFFLQLRYRILSDHSLDFVADPDPLGLLDQDPDPLVRGTDPDPNPSIIKQK
jgi:hypothetical protein